MAATFAPRREPLLALLPRQGKQSKPKAERNGKAQPAAPASQQRAERTAAQRSDDADALLGTRVVDPSASSAATSLESEERLGERFLRAMAQLARLSRAPLDGQGAEDASSKRRASVRLPSGTAAWPTEQEATASPSPLRSASPVSQKQALLASKAPPSPLKNGTGGSPMRQPLVAVNAATAPLHEHLTFEISMLLPPPMDSRQRALQSPIRREHLRKRRRRRRRKKRQPREWHASLTTWSPHMASDYAKAHEASAWRRNQEFRLAQQMQQLDLRRSDASSAIMPRSISLPLLANSRQHRVAVDEDESESGDDDGDGVQGGHSEDGGESGDDGEDAEGESDGARSADDTDADPAGQPSGSSPSSSPPSPVDTTLDATTTHGNDDEQAAASTAKATGHALLHHRPVWISAELRAWLIDSGLFATASSSSSLEAHAKQPCR